MHTLRGRRGLRVVRELENFVVTSLVIGLGRGFEEMVAEVSRVRAGDSTGR